MYIVFNLLSYQIVPSYQNRILILICKRYRDPDVYDEIKNIIKI